MSLFCIPFKNNYNKELLIILNSALQLDYSKDLNCISIVVKCVWFCVRNFANIMSTPVLCECTSLLVTSFHQTEIAEISFSLCLSWCEDTQKKQTNPAGPGARLNCQKPPWHQAEWAPNAGSCTFDKCIFLDVKMLLAAWLGLCLSQCCVHIPVKWHLKLVHDLFFLLWIFCM